MLHALPISTFLTWSFLILLGEEYKLWSSSLHYNSLYETSVILNKTQTQEHALLHLIEQNSNETIQTKCRIWDSHRGGYEESYLLGYSVQTAENQPSFRRNTPCNQNSAYYLLHAGLLIGLFFDPEDKDDMLLRNAVHFQLTTRRYFPKDITFNRSTVL
jgi:hypothetical protein